jgi:hypothetical protein
MYQCSASLPWALHALAQKIVELVSRHSGRRRTSQSAMQFGVLRGIAT